MKRMFVVLISVLLLVSLVSGCIGSGGSEGIKEKIKEKVEMSKPQILSISHRWGEINDRYSEIITEIVVYNPNPVSVPLKNISVHLYMNGIDMGEGHNVGPASLAAKSNTTIILSTKIDNYKIPKWWVSHLKNGEVTEVLLKGKLVFDLKVFDFSWPFEQKSTIKTDILSGLEFENIPMEIDLKLTSLKIYANVTSHWGDISAKTTEIIHNVELYNSQRFLPVLVSGIAYEIYMNDIKVGEGEEETSVLIPPGESAALNMRTVIENDMLSKWWVSHLKNGERTKVTVRYYFVLKIQGYEVVRIPLKPMESEIQTNILGGAGL